MKCRKWLSVCAALACAAATQAQAGVILFDDFDPGVDPGNFSAIVGGAAFGAGEVGFLDGNALWFGDIPGSRSVVTAALDVSQGGWIKFAFRGGNENVDGVDFWENSEFPEEWVDLAYSTDGVNFVDFLELNTQADIGEDPTSWNIFNVAIPDAAKTTGTFFRWAQSFNNGPSTDHWAIDNLTISGVPEPSSMALLGLGIAGMATGAWRRRRGRSDSGDVP